MAKTYKRKEYIRKVSATDEESYLYPSATDMIFSEDGKKRLHQILAELESAIENAGQSEITLADQTANNALPATTKSSAGVLLQTVRNCLKWLTARFDSSGKALSAVSADSAAAATKLSPGAKINGVTFTGGNDITVADGTKEPAITAGTVSQYFRGDKTMQALNAAAVGLGNVPNVDATNIANIAGATRIVTGSYTGNGSSTMGTHGRSITGLPFQPKAVLITSTNSPAGQLSGGGIFTSSSTTSSTAMVTHGNTNEFSLTVTVTATSISWYGTSIYASGGLNESGMTYNYTVFG